MAIFERKHYGDVISNKLAAYIMYNIKENDIEYTAKENNLSPHFLTGIIRGNIYLTEENNFAVQQLFERCCSNYMKANKNDRDIINELILSCND